MLKRTWAYGTKHRGRVISSEVATYKRRPVLVQVVEDLTAGREAHVLVGCGDPHAEVGDEGVLTFTAGGPTGGYWKFSRDAAVAPA